MLDVRGVVLAAICRLRLATSNAQSFWILDGPCLPWEEEFLAEGDYTYMPAAIFRSHNLGNEDKYVCEI